MKFLTFERVHISVMNLIKVIFFFIINHKVDFFGEVEVTIIKTFDFMGSYSTKVVGKHYVLHNHFIIFIVSLLPNDC